VEDIGWFNLFVLGIGIILFTYCCSFLFEKVKTSSTWFSLINIIFGLMVVPLIIFGQNTFLKYFEFVKYFYPYFDLSVRIFFSKNSQNSQLA
jgi:hypothetical protein